MQKRQRTAKEKRALAQGRGGRTYCAHGRTGKQGHRPFFLGRHNKRRWVHSETHEPQAQPRQVISQNTLRPCPWVQTCRIKLLWTPNANERYVEHDSPPPGFNFRARGWSGRCSEGGGSRVSTGTARWLMSSADAVVRPFLPSCSGRK